MKKLQHDLAGQRFNKLTAISHIGNGEWVCVCDCGKRTERGGFMLRTGQATSCGCVQREQSMERRQRLRNGSSDRWALTADALRGVVRYDESTGVFTWAERIARRVKPGSVAGRISGLGYWRINIGGFSYPAHHLAWLYVHGCWPKDKIDHINLNRSDNRIANLREANDAQNRQNTRLQKNNKSGFKGVWRVGNRWAAQINVDGVPMRLGRFDSPEQASAAYLREKRKSHSHYVEGQGVRRA